jgi:hypothetical protein
MVTTSGFGPSINEPFYLEEADWANGIIDLNNEDCFCPTFIMPYDAVLKNIYVLFRTRGDQDFEDGATIRPFVCLAVSHTDDMIFTILKNTVTHTEPYECIGGSINGIRRGFLADLDVEIAAGTHLAIVAGFSAENTIYGQYGDFSISGGLYLE